jgi:hypothetical protein
MFQSKRLMPPLLLLLVITASAIAQTPTERECGFNPKAKAPEGTIQITSIKNLNAEDFPRGLEVTVKNVSNKPIYGIYYVVNLENTREMYGTPVAFDLRYGAPRLVTYGAHAQEEDVPLMPGESAVMELQPGLVTGILMQCAKDEQFATVGRQRVVLWMQVINFGDGTMYIPAGFWDFDHLGRKAPAK